ncbi:hypothetical protein WDZ92_19360 [Nostoc sp. NIES-2111]
MVVVSVSLKLHERPATMTMDKAMHDGQTAVVNTTRLRHFKILPTKAKTSTPWLAAWGYSIPQKKRSGREVITFQPEAYISEHATRGEAERNLRSLSLRGHRSDN